MNHMLTLFAAKTKHQPGERADRACDGVSIFWGARSSIVNRSTEREFRN